MARKISIEVTGTRIGYSWVRDWEQANGPNENRYIVPTYLMLLQWKAEDGKEWTCTYEVVRFAISSLKEGKPVKPYVSGLATEQEYHIDEWRADYAPHNRPGLPKTGAWHVNYNDKRVKEWWKKCYLVHKGADEPRDIFEPWGASGCIEVTRNMWENFYLRILLASDLQSLEAIGKSGDLTITYWGTKRPDRYEAEWSSSSIADTFAKFIGTEFNYQIPDEFKSECHYSSPQDRTSWDASAFAANIYYAIDPLLMDLNGDGITTTAFSNWGLWFDHDANGFAEATAWVGPEDGLLVMDRNGNGVIDDGRELFGTGTMLANGKEAPSGFEALAAFDSNSDGKIDAADPIFSQLLVWQDSDTDGYSFYEELYSLDELGITSINLESIETQVTDENGNTQNSLGSFEWADGTAGDIGEYTLQRDTMYATATDNLEESWEVWQLPYAKGYGDVYDLQQAMVRDTTGQLQSLVEQFVAAEQRDEREQLMEEILFEWAGDERMQTEESRSAMFAAGSGSGGRGSSGGSGSGSVSSGSDDDLIDDRKLAVLEHFFGEPWTGVRGRHPNYAASVRLKESYRELFELYYANFMSQTHLKDLYDKLDDTCCSEDGEEQVDTTALIAALDQAIADDPDKGKELLSEFARTRRGLGYWDENCFLSVREHFIQQDPDLGWIFDTGGLPVLEHPDPGTPVKVKGVKSGFGPFEPVISEAY